jgi:hypothetical protein
LLAAKFSFICLMVVRVALMLRLLYVVVFEEACVFRNSVLPELRVILVVY